MDQSLEPNSKPDVEDAESETLEDLESHKRFLRSYQSYPSQPWNSETAGKLRYLHDSLQRKQTFSKLLLSKCGGMDLDALCQQAKDEYAKLEGIYVRRMDSFSELANQDLKNAAMDSLMLFHINPHESPPLVVHHKVGVNDDGKDVLDSASFNVFPKNAWKGIEGLEHFLPQDMQEGDYSFRTFSKRNYPLLSQDLDRKGSPNIRAMTTIGSLGGIGHKSDSDMDLQVIVDTDTPVWQPWNDCEFFLGFLSCFKRQVIKTIAALNPKSFKKLNLQAKALLQKRCHKGLAQQQLRIIDMILPSTYRNQLDKLLWKLFVQLPHENQITVIQQSTTSLLDSYPSFSLFEKSLKTFFPFLALNQNPSTKSDHDSTLADFGYLINQHQREQTLVLEAQKEYSTRMKVRIIESYLTKKYPNTEIHLFLNLLSNMREGRHTPFIVSPEGSLAYASMLNDFLLNPAMMIAGSPPMPFCIPNQLRPLLRVGVLPDADWWVESDAGISGKFLMRRLADWGGIGLNRSLVRKHAIPVFLRESEKVSHRNIPKALLNCWWVELLCTEESSPSPTSLTKLLLDPSEREMIKNPPVGHPYLETLQKMEEGFPQLTLDPWWIKFTDLLTRFPHKNVYKDIVFCFAQHVRLTDIIEFSLRADPVRLDRTSSWRKRAMVEFYEHFFPNIGDRLELMHFAQGHDETANRIESRLKKDFLNSMKRVEKKLGFFGKRKILTNIIYYFSNEGIQFDDLKNTVNEIGVILDPVVNQISIEDNRVLTKLINKMPLTRLERLQAKEIYKDRKQIKNTISVIQKKFASAKMDDKKLKNCINKGRFQIAGDTNENVIFKYHFMRNFERNSHQVQLPVSKSLYFPRALILITYNPKSSKWRFLSVISHREAWNFGVEDGSNAAMMFEESLVHGIARCVFSGYVETNPPRITAWQKEAAQASTKVSGNPFTLADVAELADEIGGFFPKHKLQPWEVLEDLHYVSSVFVVCNVNQFLMVSLVVQDNLGERFVTDFDLSDIKVDFHEKSETDEDHKINAFFDRLQTAEARRRFLKSLEKLEAPLNPKHPPSYRIWVNPKNYSLTLDPKYRSIYINGIAKHIWPESGPLAPWSPEKAPENYEDYDTIGREAIASYKREQERIQKERLIRLSHIRSMSKDYLQKIKRAKEEQEQESVA